MSNRIRCPTRQRSIILFRFRCVVEYANCAVATFRKPFRIDLESFAGIIEFPFVTLQKDDRFIFRTL